MNIITTHEDNLAEKSHIHKVLKVNNYNPWMMDIPRKKNYTPTSNTPSKSGKKSYPIAVPYVKGLSEKF